MQAGSSSDAATSVERRIVLADMIKGVDGREPFLIARKRAAQPIAAAARDPGAHVSPPPGCTSLLHSHNPDTGVW